MYSVKGPQILSFLLYALIIQSLCIDANDTLNQTQHLLVDQTLVSATQIFEFGFFSPNGSTNIYLGLWYKNIPARRYLWVANGDHPIAVNDSTLSLKIGSDGNLRLEDGKRNVVWSTNVSVMSNNTVAVLQDNGNFILKDIESGSTIWESFDYPGDTLLPGMTIGRFAKSGKRRLLSSWKEENDPAAGKFVFGPSEEEPPQLMTWNGLIPYWRSGPWNGMELLGLVFFAKGYANVFSIVPDNQNGAYLTFNTYNDSLFKIATLTPSGSIAFLAWSEETNQWIANWTSPNNKCDFYGTCGPFGTCNDKESTICQCVKGFVPRSNEEWRKGDWSGGCVRRTPLLCQRNTSNSDVNSSENDGFEPVREMKLPNNYTYLYNVNDAISCEERCLSDCSCVAFAYPEGLKCLIWENNLIDTQLLPNDGEGDLFLRLAYSEIDLPGEDKKKKKLIIGLTTISCMILLAIFVYSIYKWKAIRKKSWKAISQLQLSEDNKFATSSTELPFIDFAKIVISTNNFCEENKLGEGGFGPVYKGETENGKFIAVKRLSKHSGQGNEEFKNEIILISKLQHRNLVRLLGCCIHGEEKLLIYEYMKNKSLDAFIFDSTKKLQLDWTKRLQIIQGIARGILYLHRDSLLRIIHRDLKASNVLLDDDMNPKISDFGLARTFKVTQELAKTDRVVGTFGYMSPEYALWGQFSEKSDLYSFGVLLLEIVSGRKNTGFFIDKDYLSLLGYAWKSWEEQEGLDLLDQSLAESYSKSEVLRCIQIGLLCVQDQPADRPTMFDVVLMLSSEKDITQPKQPTFAPQKWLDSTNGSTSNLYSDDISLIEGR